MKARAIFFDRDGVLCRAVVRNGTISSPRTLHEFRLLGDCKPVVYELAKSFLLFVVTNQPDVARGKLKPDTLREMNDWLQHAMGGDRVIRKIYVCPHDDRDRCDCRKPKTGMLLRAAREWDIDLGSSFVIGDREVDVEMGRRAGTKSVVLDASYNKSVQADYRAKDIQAAARWILAHREDGGCHESVS